MRAPMLAAATLAVCSLLLSPAFAQIDIELEGNGYVYEISGKVHGASDGDLIAIEVQDSEGTQVMTRTIKSDAGGAYSATYEISPDADPSQYTVTISADIGRRVSTSASLAPGMLTERIAPGQNDPMMMQDKDMMMQDKDMMMQDEDMVMQDKDMMMQDEDMVMQDNGMDSDAPQDPGGCLIATAAYGTELAPQVQKLREIRDGSLMNTASGAAFMSSFNSMYYAVSPQIADLERQSPELRQAISAAMAPMLYVLGIMEGADTEAEVLAYGTAAILGIAAIYAGAPAGIAVCLARAGKMRQNA